MKYEMSTFESQASLVKTLEKEKKSTMHEITKYVASVGAGLAVEAGVINTTLAFGNGVSQALTGENLHGAGLAVTAGAAAVLGLGTGIRTIYAVQDGFDMVDEWRLNKAKAHLQVLEDDANGTSDEDDETE